MKNHIGIWMLAITAGVLLSCASPQAVIEGEEVEGKVSGERGKDYDQVIEIRHPHRLSDYLDRVPGVRFVGGNVSIRGNPPPLFIVDGTPVGHDFVQVERMIPVNDIDYVEVLKNPGEIGMYGWQGRFGVIIIRTR